jgi:Flp pilus assembly protein TadD
MLLVLVVLLGSGCPGSGSLTQEDRARAIRENNLGTSHFGRQDWAQAEQAFDRGLEALPEDPTLLNNLSIALQQQGRTDEAETTLRQALTVEPTNPWVNYNLGLLEKNRGNFEAAIGHFETIAAQDDEDVFLLYNLGAALSRTDRLEDAERTLRRAVERNPTHVSSLYALGRLLLQSERPEEGANWIERSQELRAQSGLNEAVGTQYGEQGPYALGCDFPGGGLSAPPAIAIRFVDGPRLPDAPCVTLTRANEEDAAAEVLPCGEQDLAILAADLDNDGLVDPVSLRSDGNITRGATPLLSLAAPAPVLAAVDTDHDGDLDLFGCESTRCRIGINDGSGNYYWDEEHDLNLDSAAGEVVAIGFSDLDNDRDIDLWVAQTSGVQGFSNDRESTRTAGWICCLRRPGERRVTSIAAARLPERNRHCLRRGRRVPPFRSRSPISTTTDCSILSLATMTMAAAGGAISVLAASSGIRLPLPEIRYGSPITIAMAMSTCWSAMRTDCSG